MTAGGTLSVGGAITIGADAGTWTPGTGTVVMTANNTLPATIFTTFNNLTIDGGTTTLGVAIPTINGILTVKTGSTLALSTFPLGGTNRPASLVMETGTTVGATITGTGAGVLNLANAGGVTINTGGTGASAATITAPITLGGAQTITNNATEVVPSLLIYTGALTNGANLLTVTGAGSTTISSIIGAGTGGITKSGAGTLTLSGINTFTGATTITAGTLALDATGTIATSSGVANSGTFTIAANKTIDSMTGTGGTTLDATLTIGDGDNRNCIYSGIASGTGGITKAGTGTLTLLGVNTFTGATTITAGTLHLDATGSIAASSGVANSGILIITGNKTIDSMTGAGGTTLGANTLTIGDATNTTCIYTGVATGPGGGITKAGTGTLTLSGNNSYTGTTTVNAGTLLVNGAQGTSAVSLNGGTLGGTGTVGAITSTATGGTLSPGNPETNPGILNSGNLNLSAAGTRSFAVQLNGTVAGTSHDQLNVTGTVNLTGATLSGTVGFAPTNGDTFTIINNDGGDLITGTFAGLAQGATVTLDGISFTISYTGGSGNDVVLTCSTTTRTWSGLGGNNNWTTGANWVGGVAPVAGNSLIFNATGVGARQAPNNYFAAGTSFPVITVSVGGYTIGGNSVSLGTALIASNAAGTSTVSLVLGGAGDVTKSGAGTLTLSGANTYTGATTISAGTLALDATGTIATSSGVANAGTLTIAANKTIDSMTGAGATTLGANTLTIGDASNTDCTYAGIATGTGGITKDGTGRLTLSGVQAYTGATTITAGTLALDATGTIANSSGVTNSGTLSIATSKTIDSMTGTGATILGATLTIGDANNTTCTYAGVASGGGGITKAGTGTLTLSGVNTYTGVTTLSAGTLSVGTIGDGGVAGNLGASSSAATNLVLGTGTLQYTGSTASTNRSFTLGTGTTTTFDISAGNLTISGSCPAATGGITKIGSGTLTMEGVNAYTGITRINAGVLSVSTIGNGGVAGNLGAATNAAANLVLGGGTLQYSGSTNSTNRNFTLTIGTTSKIDVTASDLTISGTSVVNNGALTKEGAGTLILSGTNGHTGLTTVSAGTLRYGIANALSNGPVTIDTGGTLDLATFNDNNLGTVTLIDGTISGTTGVLTGTSYDVRKGTISAILAGAVTLTKTTTETVVLSGTNTYSGLTTVSGGILEVRSNAALGTVGGTTTVGANASVQINGNGLTIAEPITLNNSSGISNGGALRNLANNNTWSGAVTLTTGGRINSDGGTLTLTGGVTGAGTALTVGGAGNTTLATTGITTGAGTVTKDGSGTLMLNVASTYTGLTTVSAGTLKYGITNALSTGAVTVNGGTLDLDIFNDTVGLVTLSNGTIASDTGVLTSTASYALQNGAVSAILAGGAAIPVNKTTGGTVTMSGTNTYTGVTTITAGVLSVGTIEDGGTACNLGAATNAAANLVLGGGTLQYTGGDNSTNRNFTLSAGTTSTIDITDSNLTLTAGGTGSGNLIKSGPGILTLTGNNTYTGTTTITAGTLQLGAANIIAASNVVLNGGTFRTGSTAGFSETVGTLNLSDNSTIALGTGNHTLTFANSSAVGWTAAKTLTITGWTGTWGGGTTGTAGKINVGAGGLTVGQLAQIQFFDGTSLWPAAILGTGEVIPACSAAATITTQPTTPNSVTAGHGIATISVVATSAASYQWQVYDGSTWSNTPNGAMYSGVTSSTLTITNATLLMNGYQYRVVVNGCTGPSVTSNAVTLSVTAAVDTDSDGVSDWEDLDDDNDGIPDIREMLCLPRPFENGGFEAPPVTNLPFPNWQLFDESLVPGWQTTAADGLIEIWDSGFNGVPSYKGLYHAEINANTDAKLYQTLTVSPGDILQWEIAHRGRGGVDVMNVMVGPLSSPIVSRTVSTGNTAWVVYHGNYTVPAGLTVVGLGFESVSTASLDASVGNFIDFVSLFKINTDVCDSDNDGIPDMRDLDSDNDGIYDVIEAGGLDPDTDGKIGSGTAADTDLDGLADVVDDVDSGFGHGTEFKTGTPLEQVDTDNDGNPDYYDTDADGDGCFDAKEAGFTDGNNDGILGGAPVTVDTKGKVTSAVGYTTPADADANGTKDYKQVINTSITAHPVSATICNASNTTFSVTATNANTYLWQVSTDGGSNWSNLANGGIYSTVTTATLTLTGVTTTNNAYQYRALVSHTANKCVVLTSNAATLTVNAVIANNTISAAQTICASTVPDALSGTLPTGGNGVYTYLWESSTTSAVSGFAAATGTNNAQNYAPGVQAVTTWYRRTVISGPCTSNISAAIRVLISTGTPISISIAASPATTLWSGDPTTFTAN